MGKVKIVRKAEKPVEKKAEKKTRKPRKAGERKPRIQKFTGPWTDAQKLDLESVFRLMGDKRSIPSNLLGDLVAAIGCTTFQHPCTGMWYTVMVRKSSGDMFIRAKPVGRAK